MKTFFRFEVILRSFSGPGMEFLVSRKQRSEIRAFQIPAEYITNQIFYLHEEQSSEKSICQYNSEQINAKGNSSFPLF